MVVTGFVVREETFLNSQLSPGDAEASPTQQGQQKEPPKSRLSALVTDGSPVPRTESSPSGLSLFSVGSRVVVCSLV